MKYRRFTIQTVKVARFDRGTPPLVTVYVRDDVLDMDVARYTGDTAAEQSRQHADWLNDTQDRIFDDLERQLEEERPLRRVK